LLHCFGWSFDCADHFSEWVMVPWFSYFKHSKSQRMNQQSWSGTVNHPPDVYVVPHAVNPSLTGEGASRACSIWVNRKYASQNPWNQLTSQSVILSNRCNLILVPLYSSTNLDTPYYPADSQSSDYPRSGSIICCARLAFVHGRQSPHNLHSSKEPPIICLFIWRRPSYAINVWLPHRSHYHRLPAESSITISNSRQLMWPHGKFEISVNVKGFLDLKCL
jgi:hypothetical protein